MYAFIILIYIIVHIILCIILYTILYTSYQYSWFLLLLCYPLILIYYTILHYTIHHIHYRPEDIKKEYLAVKNEGAAVASTNTN